jgi:hypothetical protein
MYIRESLAEAGGLVPDAPHRNYAVTSCRAEICVQRLFVCPVVKIADKQAKPIVELL